MSEKNIKRHHFLYYVFKIDKAENPMPPNKSEKLLNSLKKLLNTNKENRGDEK